MAIVNNSLTLMCENDDYQMENGQLKIVWFNEAFSNIEKSIAASIRTHHLKTFFDIEQCWNYVLDTDVEYLFLIITVDSFCSSNIDIIKKANSLSSIKFLYIICPNEISNDDLLCLSKVCHIFAKEEDLFRQLHIDVRHCTESILLTFNLLEIGKSTKNLSKESGKFIWHQFYLETLFQTFDLEQAKSDMIIYSRNFYRNDEVESEKISQFEQNYQSGEAIKWYTRDSFLYRLLNKILRSENIDDMYKFRFILSELYTQMSELHCDYLQKIVDLDLIPYILTVYRGQLISPKELDRLERNVGLLISMNTFLSASFDRNVSIIFSGNGERRPNFESVLFVINIDTNTYTTPFADIENYSWNKYEQEILITAGAIFQIIKIEKENNIWIVTLQACHPQYIQQLQQCHYPKALDECDNKKGFYFGMYAFYTVLGEMKSSTNYLRNLFQTIDPNDELIELEIKKMTTFYEDDIIKVRQKIVELTEDPDIKLQVLLEIAEILLENGNLIEAIKYIEKSQEFLFQNNNPIRPLQLARLYKTIGLLWNQQEKYQEALNLFKIILIIFNRHLQSIDLEFGYIYSDIGMTYFHLRHYSQAIEHFNKSLDIYSQSLPSGHFLIGDCYLHLGMTYFRCFNVLEAKKCFDIAFEFYEKNQAQGNPCRMGKIYHCHGHLYASASCNDEALCAYEKAEQIYKSILSSDHPFFAGLYSDMGGTLNSLNKLDQALDYLNKAIDILLNSQSNQKDKCLLGTIYYHLGVNYFRQAFYFASLSNLNKASEIFQDYLPHHNETYQDILYHMAQTYDKLNMHDRSIISYEKLIALNIPTELEMSINICFSLGRLYVKTQKPTEAINHLQTSLKFNFDNDKILFPTRLLHTYRYLGLAFSYLQEYVRAFDHFTQALNHCKNMEDLTTICKSLKTFCHIGEDLKLNFSFTVSMSDELMNSLSMCESALGCSYLNVGLAYFRLCEYDISLTFLHKSLKVFERLGDSINTANAVEHIGLSYYQIGDYNQAELFTQRRLTLLRIVHKNNETSPDFPYAYSRLACIKSEQKCFKEAEELCKIAFNLRIELLSDTDIRVGVSFQTFGIISNAQGKYHEALEYFEKFEKNLSNTRKLDHPYFVYLYKHFGAVYYNMDQFQKSLEFYEKSLSLAVKKYPLYRRFHEIIKYGIERIFDHFF